MISFDWDEGNAEHIALHGVDPGEAEEALLDPAGLSLGAKQSGGEKRVALLGRTAEGELLFVVFTFRLRAGIQQYRIVTARSATFREKQVFRRHKRRNG